MDEPDIDPLTEKVAQLIAVCDRLQQQNQHLLTQERNWREERMQLIEKNVQKGPRRGAKAEPEAEEAAA